MPRIKRPSGTSVSIIIPARLRSALIVAGAVLAVILLVIILRPANQLINAPEIARARRNGVLRVGVRNDVPGFALNGEGLEIELARELCKRIFPNEDPGIMLELAEVTQFTPTAKLNAGDVDIVFALTRDTGSSSYAYSSPYYYDTVAILCRPEDVNTSLDKKTIAVVAGTPADAATRLGQYMTRTDIEVFAKPCGSYPDMAEQLKNGTIDYAAVPGVFAPEMLKHEGVALHKEIIGRAGYVAVSNASEPAFAMLAQIVIDDLKRDGTLEEWIREFGLKLYEYGG